MSYTTPPNAPNPYSDPGFYGPPPAPSRGVPWWLIVVLMLFFCGGGGGLVVCCGGFAWLGLTVQAEGAKESLAGNAVLEEQIGTISRFDSDFAKSINAGEGTSVFRVEGSKGKGFIYAELDEDHHVISGTLKMDDGRSFDLRPAAVP